MSEKQMNPDVIQDEVEQDENELQMMDEQEERIDQVIKEVHEEAHNEEKEEPNVDGEKEEEEHPDTELAAITDENQAVTILEGLLFIVGDDGITLDQASIVLGIDAEKTEKAFDDLQRLYSDDNHGIEVVRYGGKYKFLSKALIAAYAKKLFQVADNVKLSQAALETLAIIAYKQPITRVEIEELRGVGADMMLRKLEARNLIKESGRSDAPGRPILYEVTDEFLDSFKLLSLAELPELPAFQSNEEETDNLFE